MSEDNNKLQEIAYQEISKHYVEFFSEKSAEIPNMEPPESLTLWFNDYIKQQEKERKRAERSAKNRQIFKRLGLSLAAMFIIAIIAVSTSEAARVMIKNMALDVQEKFTEISFSEKIPMVETDESIIKRSSYYFPEYMPAGFSLIDIQESQSVLSILFMNAKEEHILMNYALSNDSIQLDTENATVMEIEVQGEKGLASIKNGLVIMVWPMEGYRFVLQGNISLDDAIKIAESIYLKRK